MGVGTVDPNFYVFYEDDPEAYRQEEAIRREVRDIHTKEMETCKANQ